MIAFKLTREQYKQFTQAIRKYNDSLEDMQKYNSEEIGTWAKDGYLIEIKKYQDNKEFYDSVFDFSSLKIDTSLRDLKPKILNMSNEQGKHFHAINYKLGLKQSLIPVRQVVKGEVNRVTWYKSLDENLMPIEPILKTDIVYNRDASGFALSRVTTRTWFNVDGSENEDKKITNKYYFINPTDMIDEGLRRRKLLVNSIQMPVLDAMVEVLVPLGYSDEICLLKGRAFMDVYDGDFNRFIANSSTVTNADNPDFGKKFIVVKLRDESNPDFVEWLDRSPDSFGGSITIREYLINEFSI